MFQFSYQEFGFSVFILLTVANNGGFVEGKRNRQGVNKECVKVSAICKDVGYSLSRVPNLNNDKSVEISDEAILAYDNLYTGTRGKCKTRVHLFLCTVYFPLCLDSVPQPVGPCRSFCNFTGTGCDEQLKHGFGYPLPTKLRCEDLPEVSTPERPCIAGPDSVKDLLRSRPKKVSVTKADDHMTTKSEESAYEQSVNNSATSRFQHGLSFLLVMLLFLLNRFRWSHCSSTLCLF